ncbi:MAG: DUF4292 domain-containing protein [Flavobacteriales bacterium]
MSRRFNILLPGVLLLFLASCSSTKRAEKPERDRQHIPNRKTAEIIDSLSNNDLRCDWMSIKYDVDIKTSKIDDSFKLYVRLKQDSVIWVSATYYAVEIARFLFTPDSVKYMDRRNNKYYLGDYTYVTDQFMFEADYYTLQSLILANGNAFITDTDEKVRSAKDKGKYYLSFLRKGKFRRAMKKDDMRKPLELVISLWVDPNTFRLSRATVVDFDDDRQLAAEYSDFRPACNSEYPYKIRFTAKAPNEQATVNTSVVKLSTDKEVSISFTIPEKYEPLVP